MSVPAVQTQEPIPPMRETPRLRLEFLDGLRGLSALYVVVFHTSQEASWPVETTPEVFRRWNMWLHHGHFAVAFFIVLSGYCLMLPLARNGEDRLRNGFGDYIKRRARRILPPYFAALAFSLILLALVPALRTVRSANWDWALPAFTPDVLLSHLTLIHNLNPAWAQKINPPLWSVATEWQIYFLFPLLLLPVKRYMGLPETLVIAFVTTVALKHVCSPYLDMAFPWYLGLFALGMAGAVIGFSKSIRARWFREKFPWGSMVVLLLLGFWAVAYWQFYRMESLVVPLDTMVGLIAMGLIVFCARHLTDRADRKKPLLLRVLELKPAVALGGFSYSLYLVHAPLLALLGFGADTLELSPMAKYLSISVLGPPVALIAGYLFYRVVERRFINVPRKEKTAPATALSASGSSG